MLTVIMVTVAFRDRRQQRGVFEAERCAVCVCGGGGGGHKLSMTKKVPDGRQVTATSNGSET